jgi:thermostable 8-oxoguanine DNA glycosylase
MYNIKTKEIKMIIPEKITNFNRTQAELEEFALFSILVAGKGAKVTANKLYNFLFTPTVIGTMTAFEWIEHLNKLGALDTCMKLHKLGQYNRVKRAFLDIVKKKDRLSTITVDELGTVYGIGRKTASFFVVHSQKGARHAVLDTHILRWLRDNGHNAPKATPSGKKYIELENVFLDYCDRLGKTPAELDLKIWKEYSSKPLTLSI